MNTEPLVLPPPPALLALPSPEPERLDASPLAVPAALLVLDPVAGEEGRARLQMAIFEARLRALLRPLLP